ncbi:hypothetical protein BBP40_001309 [Aspergillus hancockii]|nr:hypothetical protein BBP40_001309 [Aspergillus hancockii]
MVTPRVAVITGSNRGIGLAICKTLAQTASSPLIIYAASRAGTPILLEDVKSTVQIRPAKVSLTDFESIGALRKRVFEENGGCDVLINNAGVFYLRERNTDAEREEMIRVNYYGTLNEFIPIMRGRGRIVNLSSQSGQLKHYHPDIQTRFLMSDLTVEELSALISEYNQAAENQIEVSLGWPSMAYFPSKAAVSATTRILARENPHLLINCCCPGWVGTDLGLQAGKAPKTPEEGAEIPLRLGFGDIGDVTGRYWANDSMIETGGGKVQEW